MGASNPIELAAEIVAAFISNNPLPKSELPSLIHAVHTAVVKTCSRAGKCAAPNRGKNTRSAYP